MEEGASGEDMKKPINMKCGSYRALLGTWVEYTAAAMHLEERFEQM